MPSALPFPPPSLAWMWIASLNIINVFHLALPHPHSYHHIPYALRLKVLWALRIPLAWLAIDPSNITTWHAFLLFYFCCLSFPP